MELKLDWINLVMHLGLYVAVLLIMKFLYVDPVLRLLRKRDQLTEGRAKSSTELLNKAQEMRATYEARVAEVKSELEAKRTQAIRSVQKEADERLKRAQKEIELRLQANQGRLQATAEDLRKQIPVFGDSLGRDMAEAVMGGKVVRG